MALIIDIDISRFTSIFHISHPYFTFHIVNPLICACAHHQTNRKITVKIFKITMAGHGVRQNQREHVLIQIKFLDKFKFCKIHLTDFSINTFLRDGERKEYMNIYITFQ